VTGPRVNLSEKMWLDMARTVARRYGLFIVVKPDTYLLYRTAEGRNIFIGKRKAAKNLYELVKQTTGHK
jgi:hypothetical protein